MLAVFCPGQGAQSAGFLTPWLDAYDVRPRLSALSGPAGLDLEAAGTDPDYDVVDTAAAQPLLVAAAVVTAELLGELPADAVVVGHSVGELAAAAVAGAVAPEDAVALAARRGAAMARACTEAAGGMTAVLGGDADAVQEAVERAGCVAANVNGAGQVVAAGPREALERLAAAPPPGARLRPLSVAGPFHTPWMAPAADELAEAVEKVSVAPHHRGVVSNLDGAVVTDGALLGQRIVTQLTAPVRFDLCLQTLRALGVTAVVEVAPGGVLAGLARRELPGVDVVALRGPDDLDAARELVSARRASGEHLAPDWKLVVAPAKGTFHPLTAAHRVDVTDDGRLGVVTNRSGDVVVAAEPAAVVVEWLAADGDPVAEGQPLARVHA
ncbi:MAG TPA: ACP S-malonyltransferase [Mycobacteriales bacterium]|nr:ACP S-malonyltransferase [Mycobacteriales bacterium]